MWWNASLKSSMLNWRWRWLSVEDLEGLLAVSLRLFLLSSVLLLSSSLVVVADLERLLTIVAHPLGWCPKKNHDSRLFVIDNSYLPHYQMIQPHLKNSITLVSILSEYNMHLLTLFIFLMLSSNKLLFVLRVPPSPPVLLRRKKRKKIKKEKERGLEYIIFVCFCKQFFWVMLFGWLGKWVPIDITVTCIGCLDLNETIHSSSHFLEIMYISLKI